MAKQDLVDSVETAIDSDDLSYRSNITDALLLSIVQNINCLCDKLSGFKCEVLPFGTTSWTAPAGFLGGVAVGFSAGGGGGGTAPANTTGTNNNTAYQGLSGSAGGSTSIGGNIIANGGGGGTRFTYTRLNDNGIGTSEAEDCPVNPRYSDVLDTVKGLTAPEGGRGAHSSDGFKNINGRAYYTGGALGGEGGNIGAVSLDFMTAGTTYPVVIGAGGSGGANDPNTAAWASTNGFSLVSSRDGEDSPGIVIFYMEKP